MGKLDPRRHRRNRQYRVLPEFGAQRESTRRRVHQGGPDDAGLAPSDVDGMVHLHDRHNEDVALIRNLGIEALSYSSRVPHGGGGSGGALVHAAGRDRRRVSRRWSSSGAP